MAADADATLDLVRDAATLPDRMLNDRRVLVLLVESPHSHSLSTVVLVTTVSTLDRVKGL
jgi:hypothetical protein